METAKFTKEQKIEICNAINTAVANEKLVMAGSVPIAGAFPTIQGIYVIPYGRWDSPSKVQAFLLGEQRVWVFTPSETDVQAETDVQVIYEPEAATT